MAWTPRGRNGASIFPLRRNGLVRARDLGLQFHVLGLPLALRFRGVEFAWLPALLMLKDRIRRDSLGPPSPSAG